MMIESNHIDSKKHGKSTSWNENGQVIKEENYKDGNLVNETRYTYFANGQKKSEANYKDGKLDGKSTTWNENGQIEVEAIFKDGVYQ